MTLFWLMLGLVISIGVARYNNDDNLFWKLAISLWGAYAAVAVIDNMISDNEQKKVVMVNEAPTQVLQSVPCSFYTLADMSLAATLREKSPKPVSKDSLIDQNDSLLSKVFGSARGQPFMCEYFDTS